MRVKALIFFCVSLLILSGCSSAEFDCEDAGGIWVDEMCNEATLDADFVCNENAECEGYCYTVKHPRAIAEDQINGFRVPGTCSSHLLPMGCAQTISQGKIVELCR